MRAPEAVLLDLDGTLTDSRSGIIASLHAAIRALGHVPDPAIDLTPMVGPPIGDVMASVLAPYGETRVAEAVQLYRSHYGEAGQFDSTLYAGIPALVAALHGAGCRLFLATAKRTMFARPMLARFGLAPSFSGIYGSEPDGSLDHKPELIAHILAQEGLDPATTVMVGDRRYDIAGARANGVRAIGVTWGYGAPGELADADALVDRPAALEEALLGSHVRLAGPDDLDGIMALNRAFASFDPAYDATAAAPHWAATLAMPGLELVVAERGGMLVAACVLLVVPNLTHRGRPWAIIENVVTHAEHRRQGLGHRVLGHAQARARAAGCYKVSLATGSTQVGTLDFYERAGFTRQAKTFFEQRFA